MAEIATRAAQVPTVIRTLVAQIAPSAEIDTIRERLPELRQQMNLELMGAETILRSQPTLDMIQTQQQLWHQRELRANQWLALLTHRATLLQTALTRLAELETTWSETRKAALAAKAPEPIIAQIDSVLEAVQAAEGPLTTQRTAVLDLQSLVAEQVARSENVQARFREAQQRAVGGILTRDAPPLWDATGWIGAREAFSDRLTETIGGWGAIKSYLRDPSQGLPMHAGIFVVLLAVFWAARRSVRRQGDAGDHGPREVMAFDRPYSAALAVALLFASSPISVVPSVLRSLFVVLALVPVLRLTRPAFDPRLLPSVYALAILFMLDTVRQTFGGVGAIEQVVLAVEMLTGIAVLAYSLTRGELRQRAGDASETEQLRGFRAGAILLILVFTTALVAGAVGYMRLARLLGAGVLGSAALAVSLFAVLRVATALMAFTLRAWPLRLLRMVQHHRDFLERRATRVMTWMAVVGWAARSLAYVGLLQPTITTGSALLSAQLGRGSITFSVGDVLEFVFTIWLAYVISSVIRFVLQEDVYPRTGLTRGMSYALSSLLNYIILTLGFLLALGAVGMDLTKMTVLAGAFGVGLGFGMQSIVNNFVSGLILLFERPIHVGDIIEVGDLVGRSVADRDPGQHRADLPGRRDDRAQRAAGHRARDQLDAQRPAPPDRPGRGRRLRERARQGRGGAGVGGAQSSLDPQGSACPRRCSSSSTTARSTSSCAPGRISSSAGRRSRPSWPPACTRRCTRPACRCRSRSARSGCSTTAWIPRQPSPAAPEPRRPRRDRRRISPRSSRASRAQHAASSPLSGRSR